MGKVRADNLPRPNEISESHKTAGKGGFMTRKLYYVVNNDRRERVTPIITNKREAEKICREANKRYPWLFLVSWQWDDPDGHQEIRKGWPEKLIYCY